MLTNGTIVQTTRDCGSASNKLGVVLEYVQTWRNERIYSVLLNDATVEHLNESGLRVLPSR